MSIPASSFFLLSTSLCFPCGFHLFPPLTGLTVAVAVVAIAKDCYFLLHCLVVGLVVLRHCFVGALFGAPFNTKFSSGTIPSKKHLSEFDAAFCRQASTPRTKAQLSRPARRTCVWRMASSRVFSLPRCIFRSQVSKHPGLSLLLHWYG